MNKLVVTRAVDQIECPWLGEPVEAGTTVYRFGKNTYDCVDYRTGVAVTLKEDGDYPFFELPKTAVQSTE